LIAQNAMTLATIGVVQLLAVISPGPSLLLTARTAVARSRADGIKVALGLGLGTVVWASAALLGLNVLFETVPVLFTAMKVAGALFLFWIAYKIFTHAADPVDLAGGGDQGSERPVLKGFMTQISNPKVIVFFGSVFVAMLPASPPAWMIGALVGIVTLNEVVWYSLVSVFIGSAPVRTRYLRAKRWIDRVTGVFLGALGLRLLASAGPNPTG
jgi:threonine/homoserine/homoserine lactone efflux protein